METRSHLSSLAARCLFATALLASAAGGAWARNDKMLMPIQPGMTSPMARQLLAPDIPVRFGSATAAGAESAYPAAEVRGVADPYSSNNNAGGARVKRSDELTCADAFRKAVMELQKRARMMGATAVVGVVSNYKDGVLDSREVYECRIGHSRGFVDLKARFARGGAAAVDPATGAVSAPPPAGARPALEDIAAVPCRSDRCRDEYRAFLTWPQPRAFVMSTTGYYWATSGNVDRSGGGVTDPIERALAGCERNAKVQCKPYAINGAVVWSQ